MDETRDKLLRQLAIAEHIQFSLLKSLIAEFTKCVIADDEALAASTRTQIHEKLDHVLDLIHANVKKIKGR